MPDFRFIESYRLRKRMGNVFFLLIFPFFKSKQTSEIINDIKVYQAQNNRKLKLSKLPHFFAGKILHSLGPIFLVQKIL